MKIISTFIFLLAYCNVSWAENIEYNDVIIYRKVLKIILNHEQPARFSVWDQTIDAPTILTPRVPRHSPYNQFVFSLPGLAPDLQKQLFSEKSSNLPFFDPAVSFARREALLHADAGLTVLGFSNIAYDKQHNALVYAEVCLSGNDMSCGGGGYWFVQSGKIWKLKKHAYLWQGTTSPFWNMEIH